MKYKPTPINVGSAVLIIWSLWEYNSENDPEGWGKVGLILLFGFVVVGLFVDFIIQRFSKKYLWTFIIEIFIICGIIFYQLSTERTQILVLNPQLPERTYVTIVYDVDDAPELPIDWTKWKVEIDIPDSGLLLTSSGYDTYLPQTKIKLPDGQILSANDSVLGFSQFSFDKVTVNGKTYKYRTWLIDPNCCIISTEDIEKFKAELIKKLSTHQMIPD